MNVLKKNNTLCTILITLEYFLEALFKGFLTKYVCTENFR